MKKGNKKIDLENILDLNVCRVACGEHGGEVEDGHVRLAVMVDRKLEVRQLSNVKEMDR